MKKFLVGDLTEYIFKQAYEKGYKLGLEIGEVKGGIKMLRQMFDMGKLTEAEYKDMIEPLIKKLDEFDK